MSTDSEFRLSAIRILRYFARNPEAADTYEGIARWRLLEETIHQTTEETVHAIDWLESRGYLKRVAGISSSPLFMLDPERSAEIANLLSQTGDEPESDAQVAREER